MKNLLLALVATALLSSCGLNPETIKNAFLGHTAFPSLALAVQDCISDRPDVQRAITPAWNRTFDKWEMTKDLAPDVSMLRAIAGAPRELAEAKRDALFIESTIVDAGLDCGTFVKTEWGRVKKTFSEIETAIASNQRLVMVADYAALLSAVIQGKRAGDVIRMPVL